MANISTPTPPAVPQKSFKLFVGVDIAAQSFDAACYQRGVSRNDKVEKARHYHQSQAHYADFTQSLLAKESDPGAILIVLEATSTYWIKVMLEAAFAVLALKAKYKKRVLIRLDGGFGNAPTNVIGWPADFIK